MTIEPLTQDACAFYDDVGTYTDYRGVVLSVGGGRADRPAPRPAQGRHPAQPRDAHRRRDVDSAAWWFLTLERTSQSQLMAYSARRARQQADPDRPEEARPPAGRSGSSWPGWFQFQPIWERISRDNPDIFD
jgi:hypothetical protein